MTLKKGNFLEFRLISPVTSAATTFRMAAAPIMKRADGTYYDLNFNNDSTISITNCRGTFVKTDGTVETVSVNGITQDGTTSDGRRIYVCTFELASDGTTKMRGIKQNDDGSNATTNLDTDLIIGTVDVGETFKIAWDISAENKLSNSFTAVSTTDTIQAGEALDATSTTLGLSLHTDGKYYKYHSTNYPDLQGMLPRGQNIASDASFTITWLNGTVSTESGLTADTLYYVQDGGTLTTTSTSTTKALANSRGTTVLVGIQDLGIQASSDAEITAGTDTVPKLQSAAQLAALKSYPANVWVESAPTTMTGGTVYTKTHSLGITQADVEQGRYKVITLSGGKQVGDTISYGPVSSALRLAHTWSASDPANYLTIAMQSNTLKIKPDNTLSDAKVVIQQMY